MVAGTACIMLARKKWSRTQHFKVVILLLHNTSTGFLLIVLCVTNQQLFKGEIQRSSQKTTNLCGSVSKEKQKVFIGVGVFVSLGSHSISALCLACTDIILANTILAYGWQMPLCCIHHWHPFKGYVLGFHDISIKQMQLKPVGDGCVKWMSNNNGILLIDTLGKSSQWTC